jgi:hypothetical protein
MSVVEKKKAAAAATAFTDATKRLQAENRADLKEQMKVFRKHITEGFCAHEKQKKTKQQKMKQQTKKKAKAEASTAAKTTDVPAKGNARRVRRARCRHDAAAAGCLIGLHSLSPKERKLFSWLGDGFISVLELNSNTDPKRAEKLQCLVADLQKTFGVRCRNAKHWVTRKVAISPKTELRGKLKQLIERYRAFYNALVAVFNGDNTATFKVLSDLCRRDGLDSLLSRLRIVYAADEAELTKRVAMLKDLSLKINDIKSLVKTSMVYIYILFLELT